MVSFSRSRAAEASAVKAEMPMAAVSSWVERNMTVLLMKLLYRVVARNSQHTYTAIDIRLIYLHLPCPSHTTTTPRRSNSLQWYTPHCILAEDETICILRVLGRGS